jgi:hypothetical protein
MIHHGSQMRAAVAGLDGRCVQIVYSFVRRVELAGSEGKERLVRRAAETVLSTHLTKHTHVS